MSEAERVLSKFLFDQELLGQEKSLFECQEVAETICKHFSVQPLDNRK